jgi:hypothetical protein
MLPPPSIEATKKPTLADAQGSASAYRTCRLYISMANWVGGFLASQVEVAQILNLPRPGPRGCPAGTHGSSDTHEKFRLDFIKPDDTAG